MEVRSLEVIAKALESAGVEYLVVGGFAANAHGYVRFTGDLDLVLSLEAENVTAGLKALAAEGYQPHQPVSVEDFVKAEMREKWRREKQMLVLKMSSETHRRTPLDIFVYEPFDFKVEYTRAVRVEISPGFFMPTLALGALIKMKSESGRSKDLQDVEALKKLHGL